MSIYLGNLTVEQFEKRCQITLTDEEREILNNLHEDVCDKVKGNNKIHIYDVPFMIECGDKDSRNTVINMLTPYSSSIAVQLQIGGGV